METPNGYNEIQQLFGNPANTDGSKNLAWEMANITTVSAPGGWKLFHQNDADSLVPVRGIRIHRLLADSFINAMDEIWTFAKEQLTGTVSDDDVLEWLHSHRLDQTGGGYNFRKSTGNKTKLSLHSYGIAIDWDPIHNPHQKPLTQTLPDWWYDIWARHGWTDGRHFKTPDPMHVQFATGA